MVTIVCSLKCGQTILYNLLANKSTLQLHLIVEKSVQRSMGSKYFKYPTLRF